ncbi:hypothetical protein HZ326_8259 [Fusarium oxysporum f. sp. albedinis]|nr:hypothetical protein HZ326_8259 [Fusarium oxysporum f. sp. albedinis]
MMAYDGTVKWGLVTANDQMSCIMAYDNAHRDHSPLCTFPSQKSRTSNCGQLKYETRADASFFELLRVTCLFLPRVDLQRSRFIS